MHTGSHHASKRPRWTRRMWRYVNAWVVICGIVVLLAVDGAEPAAASDVASDVVSVAAPADLKSVITNLTGWLVGFLVGLATLFLTVGFIRYLAADGDPGEVDRAKKSLRNALIGYSGAALAPLIVAALQSLVG